MKKIVGFIFLLGIAHFAASAKEKHRNIIKLYANNFVFPEVTTAKQNKQRIRETFTTIATATLINTGWQQLGLGYQRNVYKRLDAGIEYFQWNNTGIFNPNGKGQPLEIIQTRDISSIGILKRYSQKYLDFSVSYHILALKKHKIKVGLSFSYQSGYTTYIDSVTYYNNPSFPHYELHGHYEYHEYLGYVPSLSYDFSFLKDYACVGADIRARRYFNYGNYTQVDFGIHIGVKFGDPHFRKKKAADIAENKK